MGWGEPHTPNKEGKMKINFEQEPIEMTPTRDATVFIFSSERDDKVKYACFTTIKHEEEGIYIEFYCTCPGHVLNGVECKHIKKVKEVYN